jgi:hypothetical protein
MVPAKTPIDVCRHARVAGFPFIGQCRYLNRSVGGEVGPPGVRPFFMIQHVVMRSPHQGSPHQRISELGVSPLGIFP